VRNLTDAEATARSIGLALTASSEIYDDFLIPRTEGVLGRRPVARHKTAVIALVGRQRRFLRAAYLLADANMDLEAIGPIRSMFEFFVTQLWLALDPDLNWMLWMERDHVTRDTWREGVAEHVPALHAAALAALTAEQHTEAKEIVDVRTQIKARLGDRKVEVPHLRERAKAVDLGQWYDLLYRYESNAGMHPSLLATDLLLQSTPRGLRLHGEPTKQFVRLPVYLQGAHLLHMALKDCGEQVPSLRLPEVDKLGVDVAAAVVQYSSHTVGSLQNLANGPT
jgi:hypothetical protein